jgi:hypothetical protein
MDTGNADLAHLSGFEGQGRKRTAERFFIITTMVYSGERA